MKYCDITRENRLCT